MTYEPDKRRPNCEEYHLYPHQLPPFFPTCNVLHLFCTKGPLLPLVASASFRTPYHRSTLQVRPILGPRFFASHSYWLLLGCYPGLNLTTSSTRSSLCSVLAPCSLWLNIFSALKMETLCFSEKFSNRTIQRHVQENSALHSRRSEKVNFINPGLIPFRKILPITIRERCRSGAVDFLQSSVFAVSGNNFPSLLSGFLSRRCDSK